MGVTGLWPILSPTARPTELASLNRKRLAVDASIWIYQFLKAVRDKEGNALRNSHVVGFFRRICKLLYFGIKPVFVFDGGAPILKRQTILGRKSRREGRRDDAARTAGKLLAVQMKRRGEEEEEKRKRDNRRAREGLTVHHDEDEILPSAENLVYVGEEGMSVQERQQNRTFRKTDAYHLPELANGIEGMGRPDDPRIMSAEELADYAKQFHNGEDVNLYDFSKIDFEGEFFMSLPAGDRYNILNAARLRSRLRMGLSKEQLDGMFPNRMEFSRFQIQRAAERNNLTQKLMNLNGMNDQPGVGGGRIAGERAREYVLVKNEGVEGGWALGVVSGGDKGAGERNQPIDVDEAYKVPVEKVESEEEDEFEDVPVEGLNRLPQRQKNEGFSYEDFQAQEIADRRQQMYASRYELVTERDPFAAEDQNSLFVGSGPMEGSSKNQSYAYEDNDEDNDLERAIAMSLQKDDGTSELDEEEHLNRAIALSLQKNHRQDSDSDDNADFEDVPMPDYEQRAAEASRPIAGSSGGMIAHIVNNRANAAIPKSAPKPKPVVVEDDSDSDMDFSSALAKARKRKAPEVKRQPAPVVSNTKNPFDGPLPFEKLDFKKSIFSKKGKEPERAHESDVDNDEDDMEGGFEREPEKEAPKPLPPWLAGGGDIRSDFEEQKQRDLELNAADRERDFEERQELIKKNAPIQIDSSDDEDDFEIVEAPPKPVEDLGELLGDIRAEPPVTAIPNNREPSPEPTSFIQDGVVYEIEESENEEQEDEEMDWSESDHGEITRKPAKASVQTAANGEEESAQSKSASPEFEDVEMPAVESQRVSRAPTRLRTPSPVFDDVNMPDPQGAYPIDPDSISKPPAFQTEDTFDRQIAEIEDHEFDFSDPEDEELLAQLAIEAEEHAKFATQLNPLTSARENQEAYEKELRALRNQQKKDRRDADEVSQVMITECQALLRLFGLPYITAPMEAEAQCAELVNLGLVDGVVTDDCDIFLFGGTRVYKNLFNSNKLVECYLSSDIEKDLSLSRDHLISIAHLLGSDYTEGLPGVGPVTAVEILSEFPGPNGLDEFREWWTSTQLNTSAPISGETSIFRKKFRRSQGTKLFLPTGFPSPAVTEAYHKPDVDSTPEPFQWGVPDLDRLRDFLMATIGWTQERTDEVLVPVIRDMNKREREGTQSNITRYFDGAVGVGANTSNRQKDVGSKRMGSAISKLKAKNNPLGKTFSDAAKEWAKNNDIGYTEREQEKHEKKSRKRKGKGKTVTETEEFAADGDVEVEADNEGAKKRSGKVKRKAAASPAVEDDEANSTEVAASFDEADDENASDEYQDTESSGKKGKAKSQGRKKLKV